MNNLELNYQNDSVIFGSDMGRKRKESVSENEVQVLIRLPKFIDDNLEYDSARCRPSKKAQVEAILIAYYQLYDLELRDISGIREIVSPYLKSVKEEISQGENGFLQSFGKPHAEKPTGKSKAAIQKAMSVSKK